MEKLMSSWLPSSPSSWLWSCYAKVYRSWREVGLSCILIAALFLCYINATSLTFPQINYTDSIADHEEKRSCTPRTNIAFLKNHKCASTAIQNILLRYGLKHELLVAIPITGNHYGAAKTSFHASMFQAAPWAKLGVNIFAIHCKWNQTEVARIMPNDTAYVSIVRDPSDVFESLFDYTTMGEARGGLSLDQYALTVPAKAPRLYQRFGYNQMTFDFGMPVEFINNITAVEHMVRKAEENFHLVMVLERMEESLVLLADLMCWELSDVVVLKLNARSNQYKSTMSEEALKALRQKLAPDYLLYHHFLDRFQTQVEEYGKERMTRDVARLWKLTQELTDSCGFNRKPSNKLTGTNKLYSNRVEGYTANISDLECQNHVMSEMALIQVVRVRQSKEAIRRFGIEATKDYIPN